MAIAPLFNIANSESDFAVFSFHDYDMHRQVVQAIGMTMNITLPLYPLHPIPLFDLAGWAVIHQSMHADADGVLGIVGQDFSVPDFTNEAEKAAWFFLHATEMRQMADKLGLS